MDEPMTQAATSTFWHTAYQAHAPAVLAFLGRRLPSREEAEDLLQETFVRAMRAQPDTANVGGIRAYLFTTAHHLLVSRYHKRRPVLFSEVAESASAALEELADPRAAAPDEAADLSRLEQRLKGALGTLSPDHRIAFELAVLGQRPYPVIARELGWTLGRVKSNVHRARKKVIAALGDLLGPRLESRS